MLPLTILTLGLAALQSSLVHALKPPTVGSKGHTKQEASFSTVSGRFIVEYDTSSLSKRDVLESVASSLSSSGVDVSVNTDFDSVVFQGASITLTGNDTTVEDLKALAGVKNAWPASIITLDDEIRPNEPKSWNPHLLTGVQAIHDQGNKGAGVKIAIIDTGVDYTHPALGGGIGEGYPITHGYDFYSDMNNPSNDPMDCAGHGTFVTSLILSSDEQVPGVAPEASVALYKVFGCEDSTTDDIIIAAMIKAYEENPDIMTLSLGSNQGFNTIPVAQIASRMTKDVVVMFAAGNAGEMGVFYGSSGASGIDVLSIGSSHANQYPAFKAVLNSSSGETLEFGYIGNAMTEFDLEGTFNVLATSSNGCTFKTTAPDDTVLIVRRGGCYYGKFFNQLDSLGYVAALAYMPEETFTTFRAGMLETSPLQNLGSMKEDAGEWAVNQINSGYEVSVTFSKDFGPVGLDYLAISSGQMDYFTSWGPTYENNYYPHVNAPGGGVFGALIGGGWAGGSGTSFAAPYVAGAVALYLSQHPGADPVDVRRRLISTANELSLYDSEQTATGYDTSTLNNSISAPSIQQGAGLIDVVKFVEQKTILTSQPVLELNDTVNRVDTFTIKLRNDNDAAVNYVLSHEGGVTVNARSGKDDYWVSYIYYPPYEDVHAVVELSTSSFTIEPSSEASFDVKISAPPGSNPDFAPIFSGKILVSGDNGDVVGVPYMGIECDTYAWTPFPDPPLAFRYDTDSGYLYNLTEPGFMVNYTFNVDDSPEIYYYLRFGTEVLSFELVEDGYDLSDFKFPLETGNGVIGPIKTSNDAYGSSTDFPVYYMPKLSDYTFFHSQGLADGSVIPDGKYRILTYTLKMFGDRNNYDDWMLSLTDPFDIVGNSGNSTSSEASSEASVSSSVSSSESSAVSSSESTASVSTTSSDEMPITSSTTSQGSGTDLPVLEGIDIITDISIKDAITGDDAYAEHWFEISVTIESEKPLDEGSITQFYIPGFVDGPQYEYLQTTSSNLFAALMPDENGVFTISYTDFTTWNGDLQGTFTFTMKLSPEVKESITEPQSRDFYAYSPSQTFTSTLKFVKLPTDAPFRTSFWDGSAPRWFVDIPSSLGPWDSVTISSVLTEFYYSFSCDDITAKVGSELDSFGNATVFSAQSNADSSSSCTSRGFTMKYTDAVSSGEVLRIVIGSENDEEMYYYENTMIVTLETSSGKKEFTLDDTIRLYSVGDYSVFSGSRYVPPVTSSSVSDDSTSSELPSVPSPTGVDIITDITIVDSRTGTNISYVDDWFTVEVTLLSVKPLEEGATTQFALPGVVHGPDYEQLQTTNGNLFGVLKSDGASLFTIEYGDYTTWNGDLQGTFSFTVKLSDDVKADISGPQTKEFVAYTPTQKFNTTLDFVALPSDTPFRTTFWDGSAPKWVVTIPASLGPWEYVSVSSSLTDFYYSFLCDDITSNIGSDLDKFGNGTVFSDGPIADSSSTCSTRGFVMKYTGSVSSDQVLMLTFGSEVDDDSSYFENTMVVTVVTSSGSQEFSLSDALRFYSTGDYSVFSGSRYVPPETLSSSSESSELSSSSEDVSSVSSVSSISSTGALSSEISSDVTSEISSISDIKTSSSTTESLSASSSVSSVVPSATEPTISGSFENGELKWIVDIPGDVGPWTSVEIEGSRSYGFLFSDINYVVDNVRYSVNTTDLSSFDVFSELYSSNGFHVELKGKVISGSSFTVKANVSVTIPDTVRFAKREVLVWELSDTVSLDSSSSESSVPQSSTISTLEDSSTVESSAAESSTMGTSSSESVESSTMGTSSSESVESSTMGTSSSEIQAPSSLTSSALSELLPSSGSSSGTISSLILSTSESTTDASSSEFDISPSAGSSILTTTATENKQSTTVVTITSCSETVCTESLTTAAITTVVTTINNIVTTYTTYCPLTDTTSVTVTEKEHKSTDAVKQTDDSGKSTSTTTVGGANTIVKTITSCSAGVCHTTTVSPDSTSASTSTVVTPAVTGSGSGSGSGSVENLENVGEDVGTNGATGTSGATTTVAAAGTTQATEANGNVGGNTQDTTSTVTEAVTKTRVFASGVTAPSAILSATTANPVGSLVTVPTVIQPKSTLSASEEPNESTSTTSNASTFATTAAITTYEGVGSNIKVSGLFTVISSIILMFVF